MQKEKKETSPKKQLENDFRLFKCASAVYLFQFVVLQLYKTHFHTAKIIKTESCCMNADFYSVFYSSDKVWNIFVFKKSSTSVAKRICFRIQRTTSFLEGGRKHLNNYIIKSTLNNNTIMYFIGIIIISGFISLSGEVSYSVPSHIKFKHI